MKKAVEPESFVEKPEIKNRYIAYFDILGYKDRLIRHPEKAQEMLDCLYHAFNFAKKDATLLEKFHSGCAIKS